MLTLCINVCIIMSMSKRTTNSMRFNITLPSDIGQRVKASKNHSAIISESLRQRFAREDKERLAIILEQAYADAKDEDKRVNREWDTTVGDGL